MREGHVDVDHAGICAARFETPFNSSFNPFNRKSTFG